MPEACPQGGFGLGVFGLRPLEPRLQARPALPGLDPIRLGAVQLRLSFGQGRLGHGQRPVELTTLTLDPGELRLQLGALPLERHRRARHGRQFPSQLDAAPGQLGKPCLARLGPLRPQLELLRQRAGAQLGCGQRIPGPGVLHGGCRVPPTGCGGCLFRCPKPCARRAELILDRLSLALGDGFVAIELGALVSQTRAPRLELDPLQLLFARPFGQLPLGFPPALQLGACLSPGIPGLRSVRAVPRHRLPLLFRPVRRFARAAPRPGGRHRAMRPDRSTVRTLPISSSWAISTAAAPLSSLCSASMAARS